MGQRIGCLWLADHSNTPDGCFTSIQDLHELNARSCCCIGSMHVWHLLLPSIWGESVPPACGPIPTMHLAPGGNQNCKKWTQGLSACIELLEELQAGNKIFRIHLILSLVKRIRSSYRVCRISWLMFLAHRMHNLQANPSLKDLPYPIVG